MRAPRSANRIYMIFSGIIYMFESGRGIPPLSATPPSRPSLPPPPAPAPLSTVLSSYFYLHALLAGTLANLQVALSREGSGLTEKYLIARSHAESTLILLTYQHTQSPLLRRARRYLRVRNPIKSLHLAAHGMR